MRPMRQLTQEESDARLALYRQWRAEGLGTGAIAERFGIAKSSLRLWLIARGAWHVAGAKRHKRAPRPDVEAEKLAPRMLKRCCVPDCGIEFQSQKADGAWQRMCDECRARTRYLVFGGWSGRRVVMGGSK